MTETTITLRIDDDLKIAFAAAAEADHRRAEDVLRDLMRHYVERRHHEDDYDAWFRREVEEGRSEASAGRLIEGPQVAAEFAGRRAETLRKLSRTS